MVLKPYQAIYFLMDDPGRKQEQMLTKQVLHSTDYIIVLIIYICKYNTNVYVNNEQQRQQSICG